MNDDIQLFVANFPSQWLLREFFTIVEAVLPQNHTFEFRHSSYLILYCKLVLKMQLLFTYHSRPNLIHKYCKVDNGYCPFCIMTGWCALYAIVRCSLKINIHVVY